MLAFALALTDIAAGADVPAASIVRIRAVAAGGGARFGSATVIGVDTLATACHVTRHASTIELTQGERRWVVNAQHAQTGSIMHDMCVLSVRGLDLPAVALRTSKELTRGEHLRAVGFEQGSEALTVTTGTVEGLYGYDDGFVIRTSAPFEFGSSGGGLFDDAGNLVGVLSFKARTGRNLGFALPSDWMAADSRVARRFEPVVASAIGAAFWERAQSDRPEFLGAALREATQSER